MRIIVSGSSGLVGSALIPFLAKNGHQVLRLVRKAGGDPGEEILWNIERGEIEQEKLNGIDAVVHLAGENIFGIPWNEKKRNAIRDSRVHGTSFLCGKLAGLAKPPKVLVCASAIGFYGETGKSIVDESAPCGKGFFADVARAWEEATKGASAAGIRVVNLRIGLVLSPRGGALKMMLPAFRFGLGGRIGSGQQLMSWITIDDLLKTAYFCLTNNNLSGPVNAVAPAPVTNSDFTKALGRVLRRPAIFPVPPFALRAIFGKLADEALLLSSGVAPARLSAAGFKFDHAELDSGLKAVLASA